jgi:hypothetical protein
VCACFFHDRRSRGHLSLSFCIHFLGSVLVLFFQHALTFATERKIALVGDVCFKPPIIIKSHNFHVGDIKRAMGEITSYHERDYLSPFFSFFGFYKVCIFWPFFGLFFLSPWWWFWPSIFYWIFVTLFVFDLMLINIVP